MLYILTGFMYIFYVSCMYILQIKFLCTKMYRKLYLHPYLYEDTDLIKVLNYTKRILAQGWRLQE